jgi:hypothetical protein
VIGDFDVEGQHRWVLFDIAVPVGALRIRANSLHGQASLTGESLEVPGERWAVLEYGYEPRSRFTLRLSDRPVAFH